jgi:hypothetical protein
MTRESCSFAGVAGLSRRKMFARRKDFSSLLYRTSALAERRSLARQVTAP